MFSRITFLAADFCTWVNIISSCTGSDCPRTHKKNCRDGISGHLVLPCFHNNKPHSPFFDKLETLSQKRPGETRPIKPIMRHKPGKRCWSPSSRLSCFMFYFNPLLMMNEWLAGFFLLFSPSRRSTNSWLSWLPNRSPADPEIWQEFVNRRSRYGALRLS